MLSAAAAGLVSTLLGVGGGIVMVPLLALFAGLTLKRAAGTSLLVIVFVAALGLGVQVLKAPGDVAWVAAGILTAGAIVGAIIGRRLDEILPERVFRYAFCALLALAAFKLIDLLPETSWQIAAGVDPANGPTVIFLLGVGLLAGVASALFGIGGGIVVVPALSFGFPLFGEQFHMARATSLAMILPVSMVGASLHWRASNVDLRLALFMIPAAVACAAGGVLLAYEMDGGLLGALLGGLMLLAALRLVSQRKSSPEEKPAKR